MKKIYKTILFSFFLILSVPSYSANHTITVQNYHFDPANINVEVGDTVTWVWVNGFHTTTSVSVPSGASMWDHDMIASGDMLQYVVAVGGSYVYQCSIHGSTQGMIGGFTATAPSGINDPAPATKFNVYSVRESAINLGFSISGSSNVKISVYDITGKSVQVLLNAPLSAGEFNETYYLNETPKGVYILEMLVDNQRLTKRMIIE